MHEVCRVVLDRFENVEQKAELFEKVKIVAKEAFKIKDKDISLTPDQILFCYGNPEGKHNYRLVPEQDKVMQEVMEEALEDYNGQSTGKTMLDIVFFSNVIEKIIKINRSLRMVGGHTILLAHEGSGSFELVKIAIKMSDWEDCVIFEKDSELEEDYRLQLKEVMSRVTNNPKIRHVLHVEERDMATSDILQALDALAAHSEIFQYYSKEEIESMIDNVRNTSGVMHLREHTDAQILDLIR